MLTKLFIRVWFGELPPWTEEWIRHQRHLAQYGWNFMLVTDYEFFRDRCRKTIGVEIAPYEQIAGTRKAGDFDPAYGLIFWDELKGYDFWGHTGLDCVYGRLDRFVSDEYLWDCDVFGNDPGAICGPFSLYRNTDVVNHLFMGVPDWREQLSSPKMTAFDEHAFSQHVKRMAHAGEIRFKSAFWQSHDKQRGHVPKPQLRLEVDGTLRDLVTGNETMMFHFNRRVDETLPFWGRTWPVSS
jgi:hypothetical protein